MLDAHSSCFYFALKISARSIFFSL